MGNMSLPVWEEWIEICILSIKTSRMLSLPVWEEWIEIPALYPGRIPENVSSRMGRVD